MAAIRIAEAGWKVDELHNDKPGPVAKAAQYVRMSTDQQQYSTDNQKDAIREFAAAAGYEIVTTYEDRGRSGLTIEGRPELRRMLSDIESGHANFDVVLVYDVSRWGRFQDIDESASYEHRCHKAGVRIEYCAEQFINDGSIGSDVMKTLKRSMAAEHSRVLSVKVFAGQNRLISMGFRQGGPPGYGLRRCLIDQDGKVKGLLARLEHKSIQTDRVILVPGPDEEVRIVREIYRSFTEQKRPENEIADALNRRGIVTDLGRPWTRGTVHQVLINEKYIGNNVWNRQSYKLKKKRVHNDPSLWARADNAFEAIIDKDLFARAQLIITERSAKLSDDQLIDLLRTLYTRHGALSGLIIDEHPDLPSSSTYQSRFGSLIRAYKLVGYTPQRDYSYIEINKHLRAMHPDFVAQTLEGIRTTIGAYIAQKPGTGLLLINDEFTISIIVARCTQTAAGSLRWMIRLDRGQCPDISVVIRMAPGNLAVRDYLILPTRVADQAMRLGEFNGLVIDAFLFETLEPLFELAERRPLKGVA